MYKAVILAGGIREPLLTCSSWISFCHFFDIVNLVIFHPDYIDTGYLL